MGSDGLSEEGEKACWRRVVRSLPPSLHSSPSRQMSASFTARPALLLPLPPSMLSTGILHTPTDEFWSDWKWSLNSSRFAVTCCGSRAPGWLLYIFGPRLNRLPFPLIPLPQVLSQQITTHPNYRFLHHLSGSPLPAIPVTRVSNDKFDINQGELRQSANLVSCMV